MSPAMSDRLEDLLWMLDDPRSSLWEICRRLGMQPRSVAKFCKRAGRPDLGTQFYSLDLMERAG